MYISFSCVSLHFFSGCVLAVCTDLFLLCGAGEDNSLFIELTCSVRGLLWGRVLLDGCDCVMCVMGDLVASIAASIMFCIEVWFVTNNILGRGGADDDASGASEFPRILWIMLCIGVWFATDNTSGKGGVDDETSGASEILWESDVFMISL